MMADPVQGRNHGVVRRACMAGVVVLMFALTSCRAGVRFGTGTVTIRTASGPVRLAAQIADSDAARQRGLMNRRSLGPDSGMVFLFDGPTSVGFWMKDTLIPLDIAYWTPGGRIVAIRRMVPCRSEPCRLYSPGQAYVGAVEVNAGFFADHGVRLGDIVRLLRAPH